jgi:hypothetical protein
MPFTPSSQSSLLVSPLAHSSTRSTTLTFFVSWYAHGLGPAASPGRVLARYCATRVLEHGCGRRCTGQTRTFLEKSLWRGRRIGAPCWINNLGHKATCSFDGQLIWRSSGQRPDRFSGSRRGARRIKILVFSTIALERAHACKIPPHPPRSLSHYWLPYICSSRCCLLHREKKQSGADHHKRSGDQSNQQLAILSSQDGTMVRGRPRTSMTLLCLAFMAVTLLNQDVQARKLLGTAPQEKQSHGTTTTSVSSLNPPGYSAKTLSEIAHNS